MARRKKINHHSWKEGDIEFKNDNLFYYLKNTLQSIEQIYNEELFEIVLHFLSPLYKKKILSDIKKFAAKLKIDIECIFDCYQDGDININDTFTDLFKKKQIRNKFQKQCIQEISEIRYNNNNNIPFIKRVEKIQEIFQFSELEKKILILYYQIETDNATSGLVDILNDYLNVNTSRYRSNLSEYSIAIMLNESKIGIRKALQSSSSLVKFGILDTDREITNEIMLYLEGLDEKPVLQNYYSCFDGEVIPIKEHFIKQSDLQIIAELYKNKYTHQGINILLYGEPGTGKTEFAKSLSTFLKTKMYQIKTFDKTNESDNKKDVNHFRTRAYVACQNTISEEKSIILIDEADSMLNSIPQYFLLKNTTDKGQINNLLDESQAFTIWITNYIDGMDESTRRRFNYSLKFEQMNYEQRQKLWKYKLNEYNLKKCFNKKDIEYLSETYEINAGGIDIAMKNLSVIYKQKEKKEITMEQLEQILTTYEVLLEDKKKINKNRKFNKSNYSLNGLNIDTDINNLIKSFQGFNEYWKTQEFDMPIKNINLLLYGPPGTGKTEFSKYLSQQLKRRLIIKQCSDLLSPYIGMSEQLIRDAFDQAEREKAILFIDEVDSFLYSRENAGHSWELSMVNELLTNMENYNGIFIAATNLKHLVDSASMRRFSYKIKFDYLIGNGNLIFYKIFMQQLINVPLSEYERKKIKLMKYLTPGDFKVVYTMFGFKEHISHDQLIDALEKEIEMKNMKKNKIGFSV